MIQVSIKRLNDNARIPEYAHKGDSGMDLYSVENITIYPFDRALIHTGLAMEIPRGYEGCIRPRSGNALKLGITVLNTPGTIDSNYRGEIGVIIYNSTDKPINIHQGDRIAQIVFNKVETIYFVEEDELSKTSRGDGGFGSTGV